MSSFYGECGGSRLDDEEEEESVKEKAGTCTDRETVLKWSSAKVQSGTLLVLQIRYLELEEAINRSII